jgi:hypothetical protein
MPGPQATAQTATGYSATASMMTVIAPAGGHYFCDQIAGAAIALVVIAGLRRWRPGGAG